MYWYLKIKLNCKSYCHLVSALYCLSFSREVVYGHHCVASRPIFVCLDTFKLKSIQFKNMKRKIDTYCPKKIILNSKTSRCASREQFQCRGKVKGCIDKTWAFWGHGERNLQNVAVLLLMLHKSHRKQFVMGVWGVFYNVNNSVESNSYDSSVPFSKKWHRFVLLWNNSIVGGDSRWVESQKFLDSTVTWSSF